MLLWGFIFLLFGLLTCLVLFLSNLHLFSSIAANGFGEYVKIFFDRQYLTSGKVLFIIGLVAAVLGLVLYLIGRAKNKAEQNPLIPEKVKKFFRDTKGEFKKIVWPSFPSVVRNTGVTLIMCAITALIILAVDLGLSGLIQLLLAL